MAPAVGPPPSTLKAFFHWSLTGSFQILTLSGIASILTGVIEVFAVLMLGMLVDAALASSPQNPLGDQVWLFAAGVVFFLVLRPIIFGVFTFMQTIVVTPNVFNLVLSRLHRWTLGQSIQFFDN
ncbi:MAG: ABC transporter ATP-binding protein, partial [Rhodobacterales bacterium]